MSPSKQVHYRKLPARDYSLKSLRWYSRWANIASVIFLFLYWGFVFSGLCVMGIDVITVTAWEEIPEEFDLPIFDDWFKTLSLTVLLILMGLFSRDAHIKYGVEADEAKAAYELLVILYAASPTEETPIHPTLLGKRDT